jgi:hypothetical protein
VCGLRRKDYPDKIFQTERHLLVFVGGGGLVGDGGVANNPKDIPLGRTEPRTASTVRLGSVIAIVTFFGAGA